MEYSLIHQLKNSFSRHPKMGNSVLKIDEVVPVLPKERVKEGGVECHHGRQKLRERDHFDDDFIKTRSTELCASTLFYLDLHIL